MIKTLGGRCLTGLVLGLLGMAGILGSEPSTPTLRKGRFQETITVTGTLITRMSVEYKPPIVPSYRVTIKWLADEGSVVKPGDPIATFEGGSSGSGIEMLELQLEEKQTEKKLKQAELTRQQLDMELNWRKAETDLAKAKIAAAVPAELIGARKHQENQIDLLTKQQTTEAARNARSTAEANAKAENDRFDLDIRQLQQDLEKARELRDKLLVHATVPGIIVYTFHPWFGRKWQKGDVVPWPQTVVEIPDLGTLTVRAWAVESDASKLAPGQAATIRPDAYPDRIFTGKIERVRPAGQAFDAWGKANYFELLITLDNPDPGLLRPGMSVAGSISLQEDKDAWLVPVQAVWLRDHQFFIHPKDGTETPIQVVGRGPFEWAIVPPQGLVAGAALEVSHGSR